MEWYTEREKEIEIEIERERDRYRDGEGGLHLKIILFTSLIQPGQTQESVLDQGNTGG